MENMTHIVRCLGKMEGHLTGMGRILEEVKSSLDDMEMRLRRLEQQNFLWRGGLSVLMIISSILSVFVPFLF